MKSSLVFDIGTSSVKAGLFFYSDQKPIVVRIPIEHSFRESQSGRVDPVCWHLAIKRAVGRLFALAPQSAKNLTSVVVSGNGPSVVAVDRSRNPLGSAFLWSSLESSFRKGSSYFLPLFEKLVDELRSREKLNQVKWLLPCPEYISFKLGGEAGAFIPHQEMESLYWDSNAEEFAFCASFLPSFIHCGRPIGKVSVEGESVFGVPVGVPIYAGATDYVTALIGSGAVLPGVLCDRAGTSEGVNLTVDPACPLNSSLATSPHPIKSCRNLSVILSSSGPLFEWYRQSFGLLNRDYNEIISEIYDLEPTLKPLFFPSMDVMQGREFNWGVFAGLTPHSRTMEMGRAVLQSIGFEVSRIMDGFEADGAEIKRVVVCGGQAKSPAWNRMKADVCGRELYLPEVIDAELLGGHILAAVGQNSYRDVVEAVEAEVHYSSIIEPHPKRTEVYAGLKKEYLHLFRLISDVKI